MARTMYGYPVPVDRQIYTTENITFATLLASGVNDLDLLPTNSCKLLLQTVDMSVNGGCGR